MGHTFISSCSVITAARTASYVIINRERRASRLRMSVGLVGDCQISHMLGVIACLIPKADWGIKEAARGHAKRDATISMQDHPNLRARRFRTASLTSYIP